MSGVAAIAFLAAFTSCTKSTDLYDQGAVDERNRQEQEKKDQQKAEKAAEGRGHPPGGGGRDP